MWAAFLLSFFSFLSFFPWVSFPFIKMLITASGNVVMAHALIFFFRFINLFFTFQFQFPVSPLSCFPHFPPTPGQPFPSPFCGGKEIANGALSSYPIPWFPIVRSWEFGGGKVCFLAEAGIMESNTLTFHGMHWTSAVPSSKPSFYYEEAACRNVDPSDWSPNSTT